VQVVGQLASASVAVEMIASENYTSPAVMATQGLVLTNKYAEGAARAALLRRLRVRRHGRTAGHRAGLHRHGLCNRHQVAQYYIHVLGTAVARVSPIDVPSTDASS
jgi:hypothetical protein